MNREEAIKATKTGALVACFSGVLGIGLIFYAILSNASGHIGLWNDPLAFLDIVLIFILAFGVYKKSRTAAVVMVLYFIFSKIYLIIAGGQLSGNTIVFSLVFLYFYVKSVQGAFVFHKIEKQENPNYQPASKVAIYIGIPVIGIVFLLLGLGLLTDTDFLPATDVQAGEELSKNLKQKLISADIIYEEDSIQYFYSYGLSSILEGGSILTSDRVIIYFPEENQEISVYEIRFEDVSNIELIEDGNFFNDSIYKIQGNSPDNWIKVELSTEGRGDVKFMEALRSELSP